MSQDLFAAFGDPPQAPKAAPDDFGDDDWGDFEDATAAERAAAPPTEQVECHTKDNQTSHNVSSTFPPKAQQRPIAASSPSSSKVGRHPFADHMDFLFSPGDDEYDAGADDLENLANNPEAAMAYSKRIIAEQEARAAREKPQSTVHPNEMDIWEAEKPANPTYPLSNVDSKKSKVRKLTKSQSQLNSEPEPKPDTNPTPARNKLRKKSGYAPAKDPNVLFDAENVSESDDDDDDFGDFEGDTSGPTNITTTNSTAQTEGTSPTPDIDLLGLGDAPKSLGEIGRSRSASVRAADAILGPPKHSMVSSQTINVTPDESNPWADFETDVPSKHSIKPTAHAEPIESSTNQTNDEFGWGDFDDFETPEPTAATTHTEPASSIYSKPVTATFSTNHTRSTSSAPQEPAVPLTNIPPPVLLLSIFPSLFSSAQENLFGPLSKLDSSQRQHLLKHPATHQLLRNYLNQAIVLAHIIAGRKLRWKRDQILAQSMRIGPAAAGGKGGMKLTGIDKSEVAKEDREVLDAVRLWKAQAGKLRGAVTGASSTAKLPAMPEISEQMPVKVLKAVEGGFVAPHACALCGLKREERVSKVDVDIDDSFGEWWVNGMDMHLTCKTWWEENKKRLQSR